MGDLPASIRKNMVETDPEAEDEIQRYNEFAGEHEHIVAKSLFSAGMTWPGVSVLLTISGPWTTSPRVRTSTQPGSVAAGYPAADCAQSC